MDSPVTITTLPNRAERRRAARRGKRRTKPPAPRVKSHLPGDHACLARSFFLDGATSGEPIPKQYGDLRWHFTDEHWHPVP